MPREPLKVPSQVEYLSVLNEDGELDRELDPELSDELLLRMHETMVLARRFDARMLSLQRQGRIGTFAPVKGQEAAQIGSIAAVEASDWVVPSYRETAVAVWRGLPLEGMLLYNAGYNEGGAIPDDQNHLPVSVPVGSQMLHAAGLAYGLRLRGDEEAVAITYFGDGATSEGDFHEALNFAGVFDCPVVFVCQNNQYAISVPREHQTRSRTLAQKALAYGLPCLQVDGNDVLAVYAAAREAVERAREEDLATLIECVTYRLEVHTTVDDPSKYREDAEVEEWEARDPLPRFQDYLVGRELLDDDAIEAAEDAADEEIDAAVDRWQERMAELEEAGHAAIFDHLLAEPTRDLDAQRAEVEAQPRAAQPREAEEDEADETDADDADAEEADADGPERGDEEPDDG